MSQGRPINNTDELDFGCECPYHGPDQICTSCRPDLCNPGHPVGTGFCGSASNPNSANLTPVAAPTNIYGAYTYGDSGKNFMSGAVWSPSAASTASSGQGPSQPRPIQQQPGRSEDMRYPSSGSTGYGTMGVGYAGLAQSPASYGSDDQEFYGSMDAAVQGDGAGAGVGSSSQQSHHQEDPGKSKGKGKGKSKGKGKGKEKKH